jgi:hypothetical protein
VGSKPSRCHLGRHAGRAFLIKERFGTDQDARRAETALERTRDRKCSGEPLSLIGVESFESGDFLACGFLHPHETTLDRFAIQEHGACTTLTRRGAPVLWRRDAEFLSQRAQQMRVVTPGEDLFSIH